MAGDVHKPSPHACQTMHGPGKLLSSLANYAELINEFSYQFQQCTNAPMCTLQRFKLHCMHYKIIHNTYNFPGSLFSALSSTFQCTIHHYKFPFPKQFLSLKYCSQKWPAWCLNLILCCLTDQPLHQLADQAPSSTPLAMFPWLPQQRPSTAWKSPLLYSHNINTPSQTQLTSQNTWPQCHTSLSLITAAEGKWNVLWHV